MYPYTTSLFNYPNSNHRNIMMKKKMYLVTIKFGELIQSFAEASWREATKNDSI